MPIDWNDTQHKTFIWGGKTSHNFYVARICDDCGNKKYIAKGNARLMKPPIRCQPCRHKLHGKDHPNWRGGHQINGYRVIGVYPGDLAYGMGHDTNKTTGRQFMGEHRYIMAHKLGRTLYPWEHVHHKNRNRLDNRPSNLQLITPKQNHSYGSMARYIHELETHIRNCCGHDVINPKRLIPED